MTTLDPHVRYLVLDAAGLPEGHCETLSGAEATAAEWTGRDDKPRTVVPVDSPEGRAALAREQEAA